jgi:hypothetical protein
MTKRLFFDFALVFLAAGLILAPGFPSVEAAGEGYPTHVVETLKAVLSQAIKNNFPKDGVVNYVEVQGIPGYYWLQVQLYSPSTGAMVTAWAGGPKNGQFFASFSKPHDPMQADLLAGLKVDFADAMANLRKAGLQGALGVTRLEWAGAHGTPNILAWSIRVAGGPIMFPLFIDAQTGKAIPWPRAMDPPNGSDEQLRAIWNRLLNPQPQPAGHKWDPVECMAEIAVTGSCAPQY